jgi:hypothetical protein
LSVHDEDFMAFVGQIIGGRHAQDAGADDCDTHGVKKLVEVVEGAARLP